MAMGESVQPVRAGAGPISQVTGGASRKPVVCPEVVSYPLDDELVLVDSRSSQAYVLNATAAQIWQLCDGTQERASVARAVAATYGLTYEHALEDVRELLDGLVQASLVIE
jgi:hypothetical protein